MADSVFLGSVYGEIRLRDKTKEGVASANKNISDYEKNIQKRLNKIGQTFTNAGTRLTVGMTVPLAIFGKQSVDTAISTEVAWKEVEKVYDGTAEEIQTDLVPSVSRMTREFGRNKLEVLDTTSALASMGYSMKSTMKITDATNIVLEAATAGNLELEEATVGVVAISKIYGVENDKLRLKLAKLNAAENAGAATTRDLLEAITTVGSGAKLSGVSFEELAAMISAMKAKAIPATESANALKFMFSRLTGQVKEVNKGLEGTGFTLTKTNGEIKNGSEVIKELSERWNEFTDKEKRQIATSIAGAHQWDRIVALLDDTSQKTGEYNKVLGATLDTQGAMNTYQKEIAVFLDTNRTRFARLTADIDEMKEAVGGLLLRAVAPLVENLRKLVEQFLTLDANTQNLIVNVGLLLAALGPVLIIVGQLITSIGVVWPLVVSFGGAISAVAGSVGLLFSNFVTLLPIVKSFGDAWSAITLLFASSPLAIIVTALIALGAALLLAWNYSEKFRSAMTDAFIQVKPIADNVLGKLQKWLKSIMPTLEQIGKQAMETFKEVGKFIDQVVQVVSDILIPIFNELRPTLETLWKDFQNATTQLMPVLSVLGKVLLVIFGVIIGLAAVIIGGLVVAGVALVLVIAKIIEFVNRATDAINGFVTGAIQWLGQVPTLIGNMVISILRFLNDLPKSVIKIFLSIIEFWTYWFGYMSVWIPNKVGEIVRNVINWFMQLPSRIASALTTLWTITTTGFTNIKNTAVSKATELYNSVIDWFKKIPSRTEDALKNLGSSIRQRFQDAKDSVYNFITKFIDDAYKWGSNIGSSFVNGIKSMLTRLTSIFTNAQKDARGSIEGHSPPDEGPWRNIDDWGFNIGHAWASGIEEGMKSLQVPILSPLVSEELGSIGTTARIPKDVGMGQTINQTNNFNNDFTDDIDESAIVDRLTYQVKHI